MGVVAYFFSIPFAWWNIAHLLFEIVENTRSGIALINSWPLAQLWPGGKPAPDAIINRAGDLLGGALGWLVAQVLDTIGKKRGWYNSSFSN